MLRTCSVHVAYMLRTCYVHVAYMLRAYMLRAYMLRAYMLRAYMLRAYMLRACIEHYIIITNVHCAKIGITCYVCCNIVDDEWHLDHGCEITRSQLVIRRCMCDTIGIGVGALCANAVDVTRWRALRRLSAAVPVSSTRAPEYCSYTWVVQQSAVKCVGHRLKHDGAKLNHLILCSHSCESAGLLKETCENWFQHQMHCSIIFYHCDDATESRAPWHRGCKKH